MQEEDKIEESSRLLPLNSEVSDEPQFLFAQTDHFNGRPRKKIRLKRRERNLRVHGIGMPFGQGRDAEASFLWSCGRSAGQATRCSPFVLFGVVAVAVGVAVALLSLAYLVVNLQSQIAAVSMHLEAVIEEKVAISESNRQLLMSLESLSSNFSALKTNFSRYLVQFESFELEIDVLKHSVTQLESTFESFPDLITLPSKVEELQVETARLGSIVTDLKSVMNSTLCNESNSITPTSQAASTTKPSKSVYGLMLRELQRDPSYILINTTKQLEMRMQNVETQLGALQHRIVNGLKMQESSDAKHLIAFNQMQDAISNVSSRAMSAELQGIDNESKIADLQKLFHLETNQTKASVGNK